MDYELPWGEMKTGDYGLLAARSGRPRALSDSKRLAGPKGEIVQAARKLYEQQGVAATTVKDIAREAGITRELVYYYFANKQAVTDAVLDDYVEDLVEPPSCGTRCGGSATRAARCGSASPRSAARSTTRPAGRGR